MVSSVVRGCIVLALVLRSAQPWHQAGAQSTGATSAPPPAGCVRAEYHQFDFWIGDWNVTTPDGKPAGHNRIERLLDGCALQEHWTGAGGGGGTSLNFFDAATSQWNQLWVDGSGQVLRLAGAARDGGMVLEGKTTRANGSTVRERITWTPAANGRVRQLWENSPDGITWQVVFGGSYERSGATVGTPK